MKGIRKDEKEWASIKGQKYPYTKQQSEFRNRTNEGWGPQGVKN